MKIFLIYYEGLIVRTAPPPPSPAPGPILKFSLMVAYPNNLGSFSKIAMTGLYPRPIKSEFLRHQHFLHF